MKNKDIQNKTDIQINSEKWILYDNSKKRKSWIDHDQLLTSTAKLNIHAKKILVYKSKAIFRQKL